jgi:two-component system nitrogen regulation response regulator NtrX
MSFRVLVVDDDANLRRMLRAVIEEEGYEVQEASDGDEAIRVWPSVDPDVVLLDIVMPKGPDGLSVLERIRSLAPELIVVMMSGKATLSDAVRATKLGAFQFLEKPLSPEGVASTLRAAIDLAKARAEAAALRAELPAASTICGESNAIREVRALIAQVAPTSSRVLISGESGTGKELVARAIHENSPRRHRPLVTVNCAAVPSHLVESEMFGHERGAFTGAHQRHIGKFELAHEGTLFLDEIGDLPTEAQAKLLRALESGTIERLGGERTRRVDVRVIAATNRDIEHAVSAGAFRDDLYYRLDVFPIRIAPLRERQDDIPVLADHFLREAAVNAKRAQRRPSPEAMDRLLGHTWPGNVRELANLMERLTILGHGTEIGTDEVDTALDRPSAARSVRPAAANDNLRDQLQRFEARLIESALQAAGGNVAAAARQLGTDRANLYRRMRRLGIDWK